MINFLRFLLIRKKFIMNKLELLLERIDKFNNDRDWDQFHTFKFSKIHLHRSRKIARIHHFSL